MITGNILLVDGSSHLLLADSTSNALLSGGASGSLTGNILLFDGASDLLLSDGIDHALLSGGAAAAVSHGRLEKVDGLSSVMLANGLDHVLLEQSGSIAPPLQPQGSGSTLEFPFKIRTLPAVPDVIAPRPKKVRKTVIAEVDDIDMRLLLLLVD